MTETSALPKTGNMNRFNTAYSRRKEKTGRQNAMSGKTGVYAALDLGTNNCRLLVAQPAKTGLRILDSFSRIVRLGEGLGRNHSLDEAAMRRTIQALQICKAKLDKNGVSRARLIATEACRRAKNGAEFINAVKDEVGLDLEIIDQQTEAFLAVAGCAALIDPRAEGSIVFDVGGGSTEIACVNRCDASDFFASTMNIAAWDSLNVGVVTLAERYGGRDVSWEHYAAMIAEVKIKLRAFSENAHGITGVPYFHLLGTSGTVTTLGGFFLDLSKYDRRRVDGLWMRDQDLTDVITRLMGMTYGERVAHPCIGAERADLVLAGCAILDAIRQTFPSRFLRVADRGLREGILMKMMREDGVWVGD